MCAAVTVDEDATAEAEAEGAAEPSSAAVSLPLVARVLLSLLHCAVARGGTALRDPAAAVRSTVLSLHRVSLAAAAADAGGAVLRALATQAAGVGTDAEVLFRAARFAAGGAAVAAAAAAPPPAAAADTASACAALAAAVVRARRSFDDGPPLPAAAPLRRLFDAARRLSPESPADVAHVAALADTACSLGALQRVSQRELRHLLGHYDGGGGERALDDLVRASLANYLIAVVAPLSRDTAVPRVETATLEAVADEYLAKEVAFLQGCGDDGASARSRTLLLVQTLLCRLPECVACFGVGEARTLLSVTAACSAGAAPFSWHLPLHGVCVASEAAAAAVLEACDDDAQAALVAAWMAEDWAAADAAFRTRSDAAKAAACGRAAASAAPAAAPAPAERAFAETLRIVSRLVSVGVEGGAEKAAGRPLFACIVAVLLSPATAAEDEGDGLLCRVLTSLLEGGLLDGQLLRGRGRNRGGAVVPPGALDAVRCACGCASVAVGLLLLHVETGRGGSGRRVFDRLARVLTALLAWGDAAAAGLRAAQRRRAGLRGSAAAAATAAADAAVEAAQGAEGVRKRYVEPAVCAVLDGLVAVFDGPTTTAGGAPLYKEAFAAEHADAMAAGLDALLAPGEGSGALGEEARPSLLCFLAKLRPWCLGGDAAAVQLRVFGVGPGRPVPSGERVEEALRRLMCLDGGEAPACAGALLAARVVCCVGTGVLFEVVPPLCRVAAGAMADRGLQKGVLSVLSALASEALLRRGRRGGGGGGAEDAAGVCPAQFLLVHLHRHLRGFGAPQAASPAGLFPRSSRRADPCDCGGDGDVVPALFHVMAEEPWGYLAAYVVADLASSSALVCRELLCGGRRGLAQVIVSPVEGDGGGGDGEAEVINDPLTLLICIVGRVRLAADGAVPGCADGKGWLALPRRGGGGGGGGDGAAAAARQRAQLVHHSARALLAAFRAGDDDVKRYVAGDAPLAARLAAACGRCSGDGGGEQQRPRLPRALAALAEEVDSFVSDSAASAGRPAGVLAAAARALDADARAADAFERAYGRRASAGAVRSAVGRVPRAKWWRLRAAAEGGVEGASAAAVEAEEVGGGDGGPVCVCSHCGTLGVERLAPCAGCGVAAYCSSRCQLLHRSSPTLRAHTHEVCAATRQRASAVRWRVRSQAVQLCVVVAAATYTLLFVFHGEWVGQ